MKIFLPENFYNSNLSVSDGELYFYNDSINKCTCIHWEIKKFSFALSGNKEVNLPVLKGNISYEGLFVSDSNLISLNCRITNFSVTGFSVSKVNVTKDKNNVQPFKGVMLSSNIKNLEIMF